MADKVRELTDKKLVDMEKHLSAIYAEAQADIQKKADEYFKAFEKADAEKLKLVKQGKLTEKEYKQWRQNKLMYGRRFTTLKEDISKQLLNVNQTAVAYVNGELPEIYSMNYNALADTVDGVGGYSFTLTDPNTVKTLALADKSLLPYKKIDPKKDIPWNMKNINSQVLQGIVQGESIPKISKRMMNVENMNKVQAVRTARTLVTSAENKGRLDSFYKAEQDGINLEKFWVATPGKRTRDWHAQAGAMYSRENSIPIDEPFNIDGEQLMRPGDASLGASGRNLYNCRCAMGSKVKGFKKLQVKQIAEEQPTLQAKTKSEAETVAKRLGVNADYSKYDISVANAMNETMQEYVNIFGEHAFDNLDEISAFAKGEKTHEWGGYSSKNKSVKIRGVNSKNAIENFGKKMEKYVNGFFSTNSNLHIIRHELGHAVHDVVEGSVVSELRKYHRTIAKDIGKDVSYRAMWDDYEFVAECLAQYLNGNPSKIAIEVVEIIKNGFKKKFG